LSIKNREEVGLKIYNPTKYIAYISDLDRGDSYYSSYKDLNNKPYLWAYL